MIFDIFHAGLVWIAARKRSSSFCDGSESSQILTGMMGTVTMRTFNAGYQENLELCLQTLKEIEVG
jgi:hypothetical protein